MLSTVFPSKSIAVSVDFPTGKKTDFFDCPLCTAAVSNSVPLEPITVSPLTPRFVVAVGVKLTLAATRPLAHGSLTETFRKTSELPSPETLTFGLSVRHPLTAATGRSRLSRQ